MAIDTENKRRVVSRVYYTPDGAIDSAAERYAVLSVYYEVYVPVTYYDLLGKLCEGIMDLYNADSTLKAAMTSLHQEEALQDTNLPYGTFSIDDISADRKLGSHNEVARVRFDIFTEKRSQRADAWAALDAVYHNSALSVDDYATVSMLWETMNFIDSGVENVWQLTCTYKAYLTLL